MKYQKKVSFCLQRFLSLSGSMSVIAQQLRHKVGTNPKSIVLTAALELENTTLGFVPPRMTKVQCDLIVSPTKGLMFWCTVYNTMVNVASAFRYQNYKSVIIG